MLKDLAIAQGVPVHVRHLESLAGRRDAYGHVVQRHRRHAAMRSGYATANNDDVARRNCFENFHPPIWKRPENVDEPIFDALAIYGASEVLSVLRELRSGCLGITPVDGLIESSNHVPVLRLHSRRLSHSRQWPKESRYRQDQGCPHFHVPPGHTTFDRSVKGTPIA